MNTLPFARVALAVVLVAPSAGAQTPPPIPDFYMQDRSFPGEVPAEYLSRTVEAPARVVELTVGAGATQGLGTLQQGVAMSSVATTGMEMEIGTAYRPSGRLGFGVRAAYAQLAAERALSARVVTGGIDATYHFAPTRGAEPWLQLGAGYRLLWETPAFPAPTLLTHGFELARLTAGYDFRFATDVALAPFVGADLNMFLWQDGGPSTTLASPRLNTFVFAGARGRFDFHAR